MSEKLVGPADTSNPLIGDAVTRETEMTVEVDSVHGELAGRRRRGMFFLGLAMAGASMAMSLQMGLNFNFLKQEIHVDGFQIGLLEASRETCGIWALFILAALAGFAEPLVAWGMLLLVAIGLGSYAMAPNFLWVILLSLVWSQGLHVWMPLPNSMTLAMAEPGKAGWRLGQIQSAGAAGYTIGLLSALGLTYLGVAIRPLYFLAGGAAVLASLACLGIPRDIKARGARLVFRRRYMHYYLLCFLDGWRKQIFMCFAGFLLVDQYHTPVQTMLVLFLIVQLVGYFLAPRVGKVIDRVGERRVLMSYFGMLVGVFLGYAYIHNVYVLYGLYIADIIIFLLAMALTTYVNRIAPKQEHTQTLSMGVAMNHVAAVVTPLLGGVLWKALGYQYAFLLGAAAALGSVYAAHRLPRTAQG